VEKIADGPQTVKFLGGERCKPKPNIGVIQVVLQRASVGGDGNIPKYPAAYLKIDLGIVPGSQQSTEISNWFQDETIAMTNKSLPEAKVDAKMLGVPYHRKYSGDAQHVYMVHARNAIVQEIVSGKHATRLQDSDVTMGGIQCSEGNGWYGERVEGIQGDDGEDCGGTALVERQAISWAQILGRTQRHIEVYCG
jgi:hypothetical protein